MDDILFTKSTVHDSIHGQIENNTMSADKTQQAINDLSNILIASGERLFMTFESYKNNEIDESDPMTAVLTLSKEHKPMSLQAHSLRFPDADHRRIVDLLIDIDGAITEGFLYYTSETYLERDSHNQSLYMEGASSSFNRAASSFLEEKNRMDICT